MPRQLHLALHPYGVGGSWPARTLEGPAGRQERQCRHPVLGADNVLIRPDQHVAWRGGRLRAGGASAVLDLVLGVTSRVTASVTASVLSSVTELAGA